MSGAVRYSSTNKKVFKVVSSSKNKVKIKAVGNGTAYLLVKDNGKTYVETIVSASGNSFVDKWTKNIAKKIKAGNKTVEGRLVIASMYVVGYFSYGTTYDLASTISERKGTCYSGGQVLAKIINAMGYKAEVRFAANDKMSRYPSGITFASQHYNVKVTAKGKTYYVDGTPGCGFAYLSNSKKPLQFWVNLGSWMRVQ